MTTEAMMSVQAERRRQDEKWGEQNHGIMEWLSVLGEEVGEACQAANIHHWNGGDITPLRTELVHVAAVALAAIECLDRRYGLTGMSSSAREAGAPEMLVTAYGVVGEQP